MGTSFDVSYAVCYKKLWVSPKIRAFPTGTLPQTPHTHTHPFNGPFSGTTRVSRYQKGKTNLDFIEAGDNEWQWHQLGHMQVCISLQTDNHASTTPLVFYRSDALLAANQQRQSTEGKLSQTPDLENFAMVY